MSGEISERSEQGGSFQNKKIKSVSSSDHVIFHLLYNFLILKKEFHSLSTTFSEKKSYKKSVIFTSENNMLFSLLKISSLRKEEILGILYMDSYIIKRYNIY